MSPLRSSGCPLSMDIDMEVLQSLLFVHERSLKLSRILAVQADGSSRRSVHSALADSPRCSRQLASGLTLVDVILSED